jgi:hypothetical protein
LMRDASNHEQLREDFFVGWKPRVSHDPISSPFYSLSDNEVEWKTKLRKNDFVDYVDSLMLDGRYALDTRERVFTVIQNCREYHQVVADQITMKYSSSCINDDFHYIIGKMQEKSRDPTSLARLLWPSRQERRAFAQTISRGDAWGLGFGFFDGVRFSIRKPVTNQRLYYNRKYGHNICCLAAFGPDNTCMYINEGDFGRQHDIHGYKVPFFSLSISRSLRYTLVHILGMRIV